MAAFSVREHEEGNLGVEHASPCAIVAALKGACPPQEGRCEFRREHLETLGLVTEMDSRANADNRRAPEMRQMVGRLLGIGRCNAKQMLHQLNRFGFERGEVEVAVARSRAVILSDDFSREALAHRN